MGRTCTGERTSAAKKRTRGGGRGGGGGEGGRRVLVVRVSYNLKGCLGANFGLLTRAGTATPAGRGRPGAKTTRGEERKTSACIYAMSCAIHENFRLTCAGRGRVVGVEARRVLLAGLSVCVLPVFFACLREVMRRRAD